VIWWQTLPVTYHLRRAALPSRAGCAESTYRGYLLLFLPTVGADYGPIGGVFTLPILWRKPAPGRKATTRYQTLRWYFRTYLTRDLPLPPTT